METTQATPGWMTGLVVVFALAAAATFGLFLYRHAEDAALFEYYQQLKARRVELRAEIDALHKREPLADAQISMRRQKIAEVTAKETEHREDVNRLVAQNHVALQEITDNIAKEKETYANALTKARDSRLELAKEEQRALDSEREFDKNRLDLRADIETKAREIENLKRELRKHNAELDKRIEELNERVGQLTQQHEFNNREMVTDGQIIASRANDGFVVIDRGHQQNLRKGTRFTVFNRRGGKNVIKGTVEVIDVESRIATARVLSELDGNNPLIPGDHLHNPVYNPDATQQFVIAGDFKSFSKDELKRFIEESGGTVTNELTTATDFLVAGERSEAAWDQATKLGISILSEDQLIDFVRYTPRFIVHEGMTFVLKGKFTEVSEGKIASFIKNNGGDIQSSINNHAQVLIVGEGAAEDVAKARLLGLTIMDQSQFSTLAGGNK